jgi:hypothetical protein
VDTPYKINIYNGIGHMYFAGGSECRTKEWPLNILEIDVKGGHKNTKTTTAKKPFIKQPKKVQIVVDRKMNDDGTYELV